MSPLWVTDCDMSEAMDMGICYLSKEMKAGTLGSNHTFSLFIVLTFGHKNVFVSDVHKDIRLYCAEISR